MSGSRPRCEHDGHGGDNGAGEARKRDAESAPDLWAPFCVRIETVRGVGPIEQLSRTALAPSAGPPAREGLVSDACFIIVAAKRHQVLLQALGEERDDVAVLERGGLAWVCRCFPLAMDGVDPIASSPIKQGKICILGTGLDGRERFGAA